MTAHLAFMFVMAGVMKLAKSKEAMLEGGMGWAENVSPLNIKLLGIAEVLGAVALILPMALKIVPALAPVAAIALAIVALSAAIVHIRRKEAFIVPVVLVALNIVSAVIGFMILV